MFSAPDWKLQGNMDKAIYIPCWLISQLGEICKVTSVWIWSNVRLMFLNDKHLNNSGKMSIIETIPGTFNTLNFYTVQDFMLQIISTILKLWNVKYMSKPNNSLKTLRIVQFEIVTSFNRNFSAFWNLIFF